jgi:hypothetical protein
MGDDEAAAGRIKPGCLVIAVAFVVLLVLLGALSVSALLEAWSHEPGPAAQTGLNAASDRADGSAGASPTGCDDDTAGFDAFARPRAGTPMAVLDTVTLVCWEPTGQLRAEARFAADINATSAPMTWLCATLSAFITDTGRAWRGFTVYSTHSATPGKPLLTGMTAGRSCTNPQHQTSG